jgi:hypothetical protein
MSQSSTAFCSPLETTAAGVATNCPFSIRGDGSSCNQLYPARIFHESPAATTDMAVPALRVGSLNEGEEIKKAAAASNVAGAALFGLIS